MNNSIGHQGINSGIVENDFCIVNWTTQEITWKPGMYNPKLRSDILYWFNENNK